MTEYIPLVSVGLPTYNRASSLRRAVESVLSQEYPRLELIISDNASTDETETLCDEFCQRDGRVMYIRQFVNQGPGANFQQVLERSQGEFFMWLADDDWLDSSCISECLRVFIEQPDHSLVCGRGKYFQDGEFCFDELAINLYQPSGRDRVLAYYQQVGMNGTFYGMMRREQLVTLNFHDTLGGDWLLLAHIAFMGKVQTLSHVSLNRSIEGGSHDMEKLALRAGLSKFMAKAPHLKISTTIFKDIVWGSPIYKSIGFFKRLNLGYKCAAVICTRYCMPVWKRSFLKWWNEVRTRISLRSRLMKVF